MRAPGCNLQAKSLAECRREKNHLNGMETMDPEMGEDQSCWKSEKCSGMLCNYQGLLNM